MTSLYCKSVTHAFRRIYTLQCLQFVVPACIGCPWWLKLSMITKYDLFRECTNSDIPVTRFQERPKEGASRTLQAFPKWGSNEQYGHWKASLFSSDLMAWSEQVFIFFPNTFSSWLIELKWCVPHLFFFFCEVLNVFFFKIRFQHLDLPFREMKCPISIN